MPAPTLPAVRLGDGQSRITIGVAALTWLGCWLAGNLLGSVVIAATGHAGSGADVPAWVTVVGAIALWIPVLFGLRELSIRLGVGYRLDYGFAAKPIDLIGLPIGVLAQLVLVPLVYWPLTSAWPGAFSKQKLEEYAQDAYDRAHGGWIVALVLVVVVGAPFVEELLYRGLLQGAFARRVDDVLAVVIVAGWFTVIHFRPVEYPGLFAFGLVLGTCAMATRRLGMGICAHMAFNATGLIMAATR